MTDSLLPTITLPKAMKGKKVESEKYGVSYRFSVTGLSGKYPKMNVLNAEGQLMQLLLISEKNEATGEWGVAMVLTPVKAAVPKSVDLAAAEVAHVPPTVSKEESKAVKALQKEVGELKTGINAILAALAPKQSA